MFDSKYYSVKIQIRLEDENGKIKKKSESYLVNAVSVTDAEAKTVADFTKDAPSFEWEVMSVSETKIVKVLEK